MLIERKKADIKLGRPRGVGKSKLDQYQPEIEALLANGSTQKFIARRYATTAANLNRWIKNKMSHHLRDSDIMKYLKMTGKINKAPSIAMLVVIAHGLISLLFLAQIEISTTLLTYWYWSVILVTAIGLYGVIFVLKRYLFTSKYEKFANNHKAINFILVPLVIIILYLYTFFISLFLKNTGI